MRKLTREEILYYEVSSSWWAEWIGNTFLQKLAGTYFAWRVSIKYNRYLASIDRKSWVVKTHNGWREHTVFCSIDGFMNSDDTIQHEGPRNND